MATTQAAAVTGFVMKEHDKYVCVVGKDRVGVSKHQDYFEYHLRRGDIKTLSNLNIEKIAYVDEGGTVTNVIDIAVPIVVAKKVPAQLQRAATEATKAVAVPT